MRYTPSPDVRAGPDSEWCADVLPKVSRTFALTVDLLEEPMEKHIRLGYLLCRIADTIEDAGHVPPHEQVRLLETYDAALDPDDVTSIDDFRAAVDPWLPTADDRDPDWDVVAEAPTVIATYAELPADVRAAIQPPVREMVGGMATTIDRYAAEGGLRLQTGPELLGYCHYVAGTVGVLITNLLTHTDVPDRHTSAMEESAEAFAMLLQLVNVAKDVHDDYVGENNVYLPAAWLQEESVPQDAVTDPVHREGVVTVVEQTTALAQTCLDDAQTYLEIMPIARGNTLAAWLVPYLLAVGTLRELENRPEDVPTQGEVQVDREEVYAVLAATESATAEDIRTLQDAIAREPLHLSNRVPYS